MKKMLDLYSGLGGASQAFVDDGWEVVRIENNPIMGDVENTIVDDVLRLRDLLTMVTGGMSEDELHSMHRSCPWDVGMMGEKLPFYDFIWASPPCDEFSTAKTWAQGRTANPSLDLFLAGLDIIHILQPTYWCIENVVGAIRHFEPYVGEPRQIVGPFVFWGNYPYLTNMQDFQHRKRDHDSWSSDPLRSNKKAKLPLELSQSFLEEIKSQRRLTEWCSIDNIRHHDHCE